MPKLLAAILCGTLIVVYPQILEVTLDHAASATNANVVYFILCMVTTLLVALIGFYMWVGHKSRPSGLEHILKQLGRSMGEDKDKEKPEDAAEELPGKAREALDARKEESEPRRPAG